MRKAVIGTMVVIGLAVWLANAPFSRARGPVPQPAPEVYAEAVGQANLRSGPGIEYPVAGSIEAGTRYRVLVQHALVPWLRIEYAAAPGEAWVYRDLVTITGNLADVPAISDFPSLTPQPPTTAAPALSTAASAEQPPVTSTAEPTATPAPPTLTPTTAGAVVTTLGEANVRFGPGVEYPSIVEVPPGTRFSLLAFHSLVPWVQVAVPDAPGGSGWVFQEVIEITGDTSQIPYTNVLQFNYPTLTPTPQSVVISGAPFQGASTASGVLAATLGEPMHAYLLEQGFVPYTDHMASVFVMDLQTGDHFTLNDDVVYSGMSLTKIPILVTYFQQHNGPLTDDEAFLIADTMMCSENLTTNALLATIGDGDALRGAQKVTVLLQGLDLRGTFIMRQYVVQENETPPHAGTIHTGYDQTSALPDAYNQVLPSDLGWLLASVYQCAVDETGLLMERFPDDFNAQECRQMLQAMDANEIGVFLEAGVPEGTRVVHKHGWIADTHGDAGLVIGPGGAYVFVATLYGEDWLEFEISAPVINELARMTWNALNPDTPLDAVRPGTVPATCDPRADPVMQALLAANLPPPTP